MPNSAKNRAALGDEPGLKGDVKKLYHNVVKKSTYCVSRETFNQYVVVCSIDGSTPCYESEVTYV